MSEWIKREDREPPTLVWVFKWDEHRSDTQPVWLSESGPAGHFTHWQPANVPAPPPRTVTIEISEEDAQKFVGIYGCSCCTNASAGVVAAACRKALEGRG